MKKEHPTPVYDEEVLVQLEIESMELKKVEVTEKIKKSTDEIMEFDELLPVPDQKWHQVPEQKWQQIPKKVEEEYDQKNLEHKKADLLKEEEIEDNHQLFHELPQPSKLGLVIPEYVVVQKFQDRDGFCQHVEKVFNELEDKGARL